MLDCRLHWYPNFRLKFLDIILFDLASSVKTFQANILIYKMVYFVYHNWGCTLMYHTLSYLLKFIVNLKTPHNAPFCTYSTKRMYI